MNWTKLLGLSCLIQLCYSYRILGLIPFVGRSHYISMQPILRELAERGHEVTVLTVYEEKNPPPNYKQIVADKRLFWDFLDHKMDIFDLEHISFQKMINLAWDATYFTNEFVLNSSTVQDFIKNDQSHFDLIFAEVFYQESLYMFAHKYKAPIVGVSTNGYNLYAGHFMGNPNILSYMTHEFVKFGKDMTMFERFSNYFAYLYDIFWRKYYLLPKHQQIAEKHFGPGPLPQLSDLERNISLYFVNCHFSYDLVRSLVPGIVEIGGVHIEKPKPLPNDIKRFLDDAKDGAIFFSFGSNVQSKDMSRDKIDIFLKTFKKIDQKIIWKFEEDDLVDRLNNVMFGKWLPQNDILAHPNVKLFISHGGLLSTQEAMYHGVPILGFPFFGDQFLNLKNIKDLGFGSWLSYSTLTEESFYETIKELLENPTYMTEAKRISRRFKDRPSSAMDTAIFWIEFVIRHQGAHFLKSPIADLSTVEYYMLDICGLIVLALFLTVFLSYKCVAYIKSIRTHKKSIGNKKKKIK